MCVWVERLQSCRSQGRVRILELKASITRERSINPQKRSVIQFYCITTESPFTRRHLCDKTREAFIGEKTHRQNFPTYLEKKNNVIIIKMLKHQQNFKSIPSANPISENPIARMSSLPRNSRHFRSWRIRGGEEEAERCDPQGVRNFDFRSMRVV